MPDASGRKVKPEICTLLKFVKKDREHLYLGRRKGVDVEDCHCFRTGSLLHACCLYFSVCERRH